MTSASKPSLAATSAEIIPVSLMGHRMPDGSGYVLAEREDNGALLGAIRVVRKSGVSAEEWKRLWGDAV